MKMLDDNKIKLTLTRDSMSHNQTNYIDIIYHHIYGLIEDGALTIN